MDRNAIVIVGGGLAGAATAEQYRTSGGDGTVTLISQDADFPVHRPPLSKEYLRGDGDRAGVFVHPPDFYARNRIDVRLSTPVEDLDLTSRQVVLADGSAIGFDTLVLATGARPRLLSVPGADLPGVFYLRSLASADQLRHAYQDAEQVVLIGAGFIGMEVAASLTQQGVSCTVVEFFPRIWSRLVPAVVSDFIQRYYEAKGVTFRLGAGVTALTGDERVRAVTLDSGEVLPADVVVAGVGALLNTGLAERAGLAVDNGIVVDELFRTAHPEVYAVGDVANFPDPIGGRMHLEHWDNALAQGRALGATIAGVPAPFEHVAYFFSDLFDISLNMIGYPGAWNDIIVRGDPDAGRFTTLYLRDGVVRAVLMLNDDGQFDAWTELVKAQAPVAALPHALSDPAVVPDLLHTTRRGVQSSL